MTYFEGFVVPVREADKSRYIAHATKFAPLAQEFGVKRMVEAWASDVPHGKLTDFYRAVDAKEDEQIVFSWFEYGSKKERDEAGEKFRSDPRMKNFETDIPFEGKRMIYGGFETIVESGNGSGSYINGLVAPVPSDRKESYRQLSERQAEIFREHGALRLVHAWGDDVPEGKVTDFRRAVMAEPGESVVFAFIEWRSKEECQSGWDKIMKDERMQHSGDMHFDGKRMFWGGFDLIYGTAEEAQAPATAAPVTA